MEKKIEFIGLPKLDKSTKDFLEDIELNSFTVFNPSLWGKPRKEIKKAWKKLRTSNNRFSKTK